jgi:hypothetical protein
MKKTDENAGISVNLVTDPDFRRIAVSGVFGSLNPAEGVMTFYLDSLIPRMKDEQSAIMETKELERRLMVEVRLPAKIFADIARWMNDNVQRMDEQLEALENRRGAEEP